MKSRSEVVAIIPALNEEKNMPAVISETRKHVRNIIVIDDGSTDNTYEAAKANGAIALRHKKNMGKGEALKTGFKYVLDNMPEIKAVVVIDADLQLDPSEAPLVLEPVLKGDVDFIMGKRDFSKVPFRHRLGNFVWRTTFNLLFGTKLKDTNCGLVALSRKALESMDMNKIYGGYIVDNSILILMIRNRLKIGQVPVHVTYHHISKVPRGVRMVLGVFVFIIKEGINYRLGR